MKILFNCSGNVSGGSVQNAANFIKYAAQNKKHEFYYIVSNRVKKILDVWNVKPFHLTVMDSPARNRIARNNIYRLEKKYKPDIVYTMAGPTYIKFKSLHVMGISDPYITHANIKSFLHNRRYYQAIFFYLMEMTKGLYALYSADYFLFQTLTSRNGFIKRFKLNKSKTHILENALGENFLKKSLFFQQKSCKKKILIPSAYAPHKNLEIIFCMCKILKEINKLDEFNFIITIPKNAPYNNRVIKLGLEGAIHNIGPFNYNDAYKLYAKADAILLPSILETFSTSYLEAIAVCKPLIVADTSFSREICADYANYYNPFSAEDAVKALLHTINSNLNLNERDKIISRYGSQQERFAKALSILETIFEKGN